MIPGLKEFVDTGNTKAIEEFLQVEMDDYLVYIDTAYDLLSTVDNREDGWYETLDDWLAATKKLLDK